MSLSILCISIYTLFIFIIQSYITRSIWSQIRNATLSTIRENTGCAKKFLFNKIYQKFFAFTIVVRDYINTMMPTFDFNFYLYQAIKQHGYTLTIELKLKSCLRCIDIIAYHCRIDIIAYHCRIDIITYHCRIDLIFGVNLIQPF